MKKLLSLLIISVFLTIVLISLASAAECSLPNPFKQYQSGELTGSCSNCTYNNLTKIVYPNQSIALLGQYTMDKNGTNFNYSYTPATLGIWTYSYEGDLNGVTTTQTCSFEVTPTGNTLTTSDSISYIAMLLLFILLDIFAFYIIAVLNLENYKRGDETIGISLRKYFKIVLIGISYGLVLLTLNLMNAVAINLSITQFAGIVGGLFSLMLNGALVWTIIISIWIAITMWKDSILIKEIRKRLEEGEWGIT